MEPVIPAYQAFAEEMGPILWSEIIRQGVKNPSQAYKNMIMQLGYESKYGTTRLAKEQNNYGGVGYNDTTKTYNSYKDKKHFARDYVRLMNSRYKNAVQAKTLSDYAKQIRDLGYYTDTLENYSRNLNGMKSFQRAVYNHMQANPDMYQGGISMVKTSDGNKKLVIDPAVYGLEKPGFESTWKPEQSTKTIYPLNDTTPKSISSWSGADAPNTTPRLKDFQEVRQEDLNRGIDVYGDPVSPFSLRLKPPSLTSLLQLNSPEEQAEQWFADALGISDMVPQAPSLFPKLKDGKVPNDPYERFKYSLPDNQKNTPESEYNTRRYWELNGRPKSFQEAVEREMYDLQEDGWHANSVSYNQDTGEYEFMKPRNHPTVHKELEWYNSDDAKEFRKKYKHIQPKNSNFDKYVPRLKNGKLPKFEDGTIPGLGPKKNIKPKDLQLSTKGERGLETAGPIEKALIAWLGGRAITGGLSMYNRARAFKQAKETYRQARQWNEQTRDASRAWKIADADQIARNSLYSGSSEPLGWLYDTLLRPVINTYDKLNQSPIGIILP